MSTSNLLDLSFEIREKILIELFTSQIIARKCRWEKRRNGDWKLEGLPEHSTTFSPSKSSAKCYGILLACHQCHAEGIVLYYRHARVVNFSHLPIWCLRQPPFYHPSSKVQYFEYQEPNWSYRWGNHLILPGATSNLSMVMQYSQHFIETDQFRPDRFLFAKSVRTIRVNLPLKNFSHWERLGVDFPRMSVPTDEALLYYHAGYLPNGEPSKPHQDNIHHQMLPAKRSEKEAPVKAVLKAHPKSVVLARFPTEYKYQGVYHFEVCDFDVRSTKSISRRQLSEEEIEEQVFLKTETCQENLRHTDWVRAWNIV